MSKEQIEEIRKDIFAAFGGYAKWEEDWQSLAEAVYNAGYRKQSEGKWKQAYNSFPRYFCTNCNHLYNNKEYKYCPNCGAKMKGCE